jgi:HSP20 family protein
MDRLLQGSSPGHGFAGLAPTAPGAAPGVNIWRESDAIVLEAEVPGFAREDIEILTTADSVKLRGRREASRPAGAAALRVERVATQFERAFRLPVEIDGESAEATLQQGVLRVRLPIAAVARPRRIQIGAPSGDQAIALPDGSAESSQAPEA